METVLQYCQYSSIFRLCSVDTVSYNRKSQEDKSAFIFGHKPSLVVLRTGLGTKFFMAYRKLHLSVDNSNSSVFSASFQEKAQ
jgi:hypothetical protein